MRQFAILNSKKQHKNSQNTGCNCQIAILNSKKQHKNSQNTGCNCQIAILNSEIFENLGSKF